MSTKTKSPISFVGKAGVLVLLAIAGVLALVATADRAGASVITQWPFAISKARLQFAAAIERESGESAVEAAERFVSQAPLRRSNLSRLATAHQLSGDRQRAADTFRIASSLGWRDVLAQGNAVSLALGNGEYAIAASRMEALVRAEPGSDVTRQLLEVISQVPEAREALAAAMAAGDGWGDNAITGLHQLPQEEIARRIPLLADAYGFGFRPYEPLARREADRIYPQDALLGWEFWNAVAGSGDTAEMGLWSSSFATIGESGFAGRSPFEWGRARQTTVTLRNEQIGGRQQLTVSGRNFSAENVATQRVPLAAGQYALSWEASASTPGRPDLLLSADCAEPVAPLELGPAVAEEGVFYRLLVVGADCTLAEVRVFAPSSESTQRWIASPRIIPID